MMEHPPGLDGVFAALAGRHRREILVALSLQPCAISRLAEMRGLSLPAIHKHIRALEEAGLVIRRKLGRTNVLALNRTPLRLLQEWVGQFHPYWGDERETLQNYARALGGDHPDEEESA